ncbi:hypothetical protein SISSUDRAFT_1050296 [Sistotremastrum suecicum HHB10207 ss-3]|uniref:Carbohydrate-binding module family 13 protein n=1 Tax=Sistotremastrum suecicum HHB10207 ss-3 TaxID=1314776 RepID=A0A166BAV3_9AGAM|nr:hypothetical protein SISSUDRAFT_1050296 [Sistotremastrum suecicum HHB10207 ss-3]
MLSTAGNALLIAALTFGRIVEAQSYSATYLPSDTPKQSEQGQTGTNQCGGGSSQTSNCQNVFINSVEDFCLYAPPDPDGTIGDTERIEVSWCMKSGYGTRLIPDGTIHGAHFVQTPDFVQVTGVGDLTKLNIAAGDEGGELDPHGADGNGNPIGGLVFGSSFGKLQQYHEWTNFMSDTEFCFRACKDAPKAPTFCQHIYDVLGCQWNMPANYNAGSFEDCIGNSGEPMGVYGASTFHQGDPVTPSAHPQPGSSQCTPFATISNGIVQASTTAPSTSTTSTTSTSTSTSPSAPITSSSPSSSPTTTLPSPTSTSSTSATGTESHISAPARSSAIAGSSTESSSSSGSTSGSETSTIPPGTTSGGRSVAPPSSTSSSSSAGATTSTSGASSSIATLDLFNLWALGGVILGAFVAL